MKEDIMLAVQDLSVSFSSCGGRILAVNDISFTLHDDEILGIVGESGSGKSVTIKSIMRLLQEPPARIDSGSILYQGADLLQLDDEQMRRVRGAEISMIFQNPMTAFNPVLPIGIQIGEALEFHADCPCKDAKYAKVLELLKDVGISNPERRYHQYPHEFSGGMLQRAMIASSLICSPRIVLADEPTTGLDVTIQAQIINLIRNLKSQYAMSVIWITHDLSLLAGFAERIVVMYAGRMVEKALTEDLYYDAKHPYTKGMLASIPTANTDRNADLYSIPGMPPNPASLPQGCAFYDRCPERMACCARIIPPEIMVSDSHAVSCWRYCPEIPEVQDA